MSKKYKKYRQNVFVRILKIALFLMLSYAAVKVGIAGGNMLFNSNTDIIKNTHVESFKATLNKSIPLINTVYNSGNISVSLSGELRNLIGGIFNFDLDNPVTILNAQSSFMYTFYNNNYQEYLAQEMKKDMEKREHENIDDGGKTAEDNKGDKVADNSGTADNAHEFSQDQSSIYYEGEDEKERDRSDDNVVYNGKIAINNQSKYKVDDALIDKLLKEPLKFKFEKKGPQILIYHTHTTESYLRKLEDMKKKGISSWTNDSRYNVVRVGEELNQFLKKKYGFNVMHNGTINDFEYNDSYFNAGKTVNNILKGNPSIKVVIDLHRDGLDGVQKLRKVKKVGGKNAAQLMFVIGTNHPDWKENFKLALKLQKKLNEQYPGLMLPINLRKAKFNQYVKYGAFILEVGGDGNTLEEALKSTECFAKAINDVLGSMK